MSNRTVFFISDGTGITAETFGNAILAQFEMKARHVRLPFIDKELTAEGQLVNPLLKDLLHEQAAALMAF